MVKELTNFKLQNIIIEITSIILYTTLKTWNNILIFKKKQSAQIKAAVTISFNNSVYSLLIVLVHTLITK